MISIPQNRAYQSPGTRLKQSTYPKRRTDAVYLTVAVLVHQPEVCEILRAPMLLGPYVVHVYLFTIVQSLLTGGTEAVLPPGKLPRVTMHRVSGTGNSCSLSWTRLLRDTTPLALRIATVEAEIVWIRETSPFPLLQATAIPLVSCMGLAGSQLECAPRLVQHNHDGEFLRLRKPCVGSREDSARQ